jgi:predicted ATPase/class 3 adenylate cyclase
MEYLAKGMEALTRTESSAKSIPTGIVTFFFSDIEGSTARWESHHDAMREAVERHERLVRAAIEQFGGYVFKIVGDAFCASFQDTDDAIQAAREAQRALAAEDFTAVGGLRIRIGIHTGTSHERDDDYYGPTVNRVARLMSIGHGGQVLVSDATRDALKASPRSELSFVDLGLRRLKDLTQPERVWQLAIPGSTLEFPPLSSLDARPNNLPFQVTPLVGREADVRDVKGRLHHARLLTITGAGGVGKTRIALQVAADEIDRYPDGVWFVDLAPVSDSALVPGVVARVLGVEPSATRSVVESIIGAVRDKSLLIVLDNCEHLVDAVASIATALLQQCPHTRILATSRQPIAIAGETLFRLPSLSVPSADENHSPERALEFGAVALFVARAVSADARFALTAETVPLVVDICRRLDGIPLALELAAARVRFLNVKSLASGLDERFQLLTGGSRAALPRQKTLAALIDWSYGLLSGPERTTFDRIGIFPSGFDLEAATAVAGGDSSPIEVLDLLSSLVDKSLLGVDTSGDRERYRLLESTRAYALEKLTGAGDSDRIARLHAEYFRDRSLSLVERLSNGAMSTLFAALEPDLDNYRAALRWGFQDGGDVAITASIAGCLTMLWFGGGLNVEGRSWIEAATSRLDERSHPREAARLWLSLSQLYSGKRQYDAADRARLLFDRLGDRRLAARALLPATGSLLQMGRLDEADATVRRALVTFAEFDDKPAIARGYNVQGSIAKARLDFTAAREFYAQAIAVNTALGDEITLAGVYGSLAELEFADGDASEALRNVERVIDLRTRSNNATYLANYYGAMSAYLIALDDIDGAREAAREALRRSVAAQEPDAMAIALQDLALIAAMLDRVELAARLLGKVDARFAEQGLEREPTERWCFDRLIAILRAHLSETSISDLAAEGSGWPEDRALAEAMAI